MAHDRVQHRFSAACISTRSLAKCVRQANSPLCRRTRAAAVWSIRAHFIGNRNPAILMKVVNDIADTKKKYGENRKRLRLLCEALVAHT